MTRFLADLLVPGIAVVEATAPDEEHRARAGVILHDTTMGDGQRGWVILDHDGRTHTLADDQIHWCRHDGCPTCPRPDRPALRRALAREMTAQASRTGDITWVDTARRDRIRTLTKALGSTLDDARIIDAGPDAELLWYRALQLAKRAETDGVLSAGQLGRLHPKPAAIKALVRVGLLRQADGGAYRLAGWLDWNKSRAQLDADRAAEKERKAAAGRKGAARRWHPDPTDRDEQLADEPTEPMTDEWQPAIGTDGRTMTGGETFHGAEQSRAEQSRALELQVGGSLTGVAAGPSDPQPASPLGLRQALAAGNRARIGATA
jgi:hypothetical protein